MKERSIFCLHLFWRTKL